MFVQIGDEFRSDKKARVENRQVMLCLSGEEKRGEVKRRERKAGAVERYMLPGAQFVSSFRAVERATTL